MRGRSPRVRGSRVREGWPQAPRGSIPACAGEPATVSCVPAMRRVDPRVCGGAASACSPARAPAGRSPRVRGSLEAANDELLLRGSIPACAGEPERAPQEQRTKRVDPRVCGGADVEGEVMVVCKGRSPRVRGSPGNHRALLRGRGSIPACAGEPETWRTPAPAARVDPRVCGGASSTAASSSSPSGRSPRVRGSRKRRHSNVRLSGSIPACAGEPGRRGHRRAGRRVDPRVCGGAPAVIFTMKSTPGRSPRVRGSPGALSGGCAAVGSIPACAGEPSHSPT